MSDSNRTAQERADVVDRRARKFADDLAWDRREHRPTDAIRRAGPINDTPGTTREGRSRWP